jgi:hypothetical protein
MVEMIDRASAWLDVLSSGGSEGVVAATMSRLLASAYTKERGMELLNNVSDIEHWVRKLVECAQWRSALVSLAGLPHLKNVWTRPLAVSCVCVATTRVRACARACV